MRRSRIILAFLFFAFTAVLSGAVLASLKNPGEASRCNVYLRAIESVNLCTVAAPDLALSPARPTESPVMTLYATTVSGPCETYHELYSCY